MMRRMRAALASWTLVAAVFATACAAPADQPCRVGSDCASGVCLPDGRCAEGDAGGTADGGAPDGSLGDAPAGCVPDHDGSLARAEITLGAGLSAPFRIARDAQVDTSGIWNADGTRRWDLSATLAGDHDVAVETTSVGGAWYEPSFPGAAYAVRLGDAEELLGVFAVQEDALLLLGVVSPEGGPTRTELVYDPPVTVLRFPLAAGAAFVTDTTVTGLAAGVFATYLERYDVLVDAVGSVATPYGEFPVLRVRTDLRRTVGFVVTTARTFAFAAECYGVVATVRGHDGDTSEELTSAAEVRRLAP
jgi:hypothetical protein